MCKYVNTFKESPRYYFHNFYLCELHSFFFQINKCEVELVLWLILRLLLPIFIVTIPAFTKINKYIFNYKKKCRHDASSTIIFQRCQPYQNPNTYVIGWNNHDEQALEKCINRNDLESLQNKKRSEQSNCLEQSILVELKRKFFKKNHTSFYVLICVVSLNIKILFSLFFPGFSNGYKLRNFAATETQFNLWDLSL